MNPKLFRIINNILILAILSTFALEVVLLTRVSDKATVSAVNDGGDAGGADGGGAAADTSSADQQFTQDQSSKCITRMKDFMRGKQMEFGEFMNTHFRSDKPTSELIPPAIERYRRYREDVRNEMKKFSPIGRTEISAANSEDPACQKAVNEDFMLIKEVMRGHVMENAYAKKETRLLDKYKQINKKLDNLNATIGQMAGFFGTFAQKLPCYATKCIKG